MNEDTKENSVPEPSSTVTGVVVVVNCNMGESEGLSESVVSVDEENSSVALVSVSSEEVEPTVGETVTAGIEETDWGEIDAGIKVSGVCPDPSLSVKGETELVCSVVMVGSSVLDDSGSSVLSSISVDASVVSSLTDCDAGVDVCNS